MLIQNLGRTNKEYYLLYFHLTRNAFCFPHKCCITIVNYSQVHLKTIVYAKFVGKTKCIAGYMKVANMIFLILANSPLFIDHFHKWRPHLHSFVFIMLIRPTVLILRQIFY